MKTLITGGTVVNASGPFEADVLVQDEIIIALGARGSSTSESWKESADRVLDATGQFVIPGAIDGHTHMEMPFGGTYSVDTFETGTRAAAFGGTTTIIDFAIQSKGHSLGQGLDTWHGKADGNCAIDYGFHMIISDVNEQSLKEMDQLVGEGITSFKLFMAYPGVFYSTDGEILQAMQQASGNGATIMMHAEQGIAIDLLVAQDLARDGFEGAKYVCSPPLRPESYQGELWRGLRTDDLSLVSTDHCPFCFKEHKELGIGNFSKIPNGLPGVEHRLDLIFQGVNMGEISLGRWVDVTATTPAQMFGLFPRKGVIAPGSDADVVIYDPNGTHTISAATHHMNVDYSAYEGMEVKGRATTVLSRGAVIIEDDQYVGKAGAGRFLERGLNGCLR